jgi:hypothetical protein
MIRALLKASKTIKKKPPLKTIEKYLRIQKKRYLQRLPSAVDIYLKTCLRSSCCESWMVSTHFNTMQQWKSNFTILNNRIVNLIYLY